MYLHVVVLNTHRSSIHLVWIISNAVCILYDIEVFLLFQILTPIKYSRRFSKAEVAWAEWVAAFQADLTSSSAKWLPDVSYARKRSTTIARQGYDSFYCFSDCSELFR